MWSPTIATFLRLLPDEPFLLYVGDVRSDKGSDVLFDAYQRMNEPPPLVLIGQVSPEVRSMAGAGALFLGERSNAVARYAMHRSLAVVVPSVWSEPFPMAVLEALAAGRPVVASITGGIPEMVRDDREALLVEPGDAAALAAALSRITHDDALRDRLAASALLRADAFTATAILPQFEAAYERSLAGRRR